MAMLFVQAAKPKGPDLREMLHRHLSGYQDGRDINTLHASEVTKQEPEFCARRKALAIVLGKKNPDEFLSTSLAVTFQIGRDIERDTVHWFGDMGRAVGHWKCESCGSVQKYCKRPPMCPECKCRLWKYVEWRAVCPDTDVSCGIDLLLDIGQPKLHIVEIKSLDKDEFKALIAPQGEHRLRTRLYMMCAGKSVDPFAKRVDPTCATVMYVSKGGFGCATPEVADYTFKDAKFSPFKPFRIERMDEEVQPYYDKAAAFEAFKKSKNLPSRICNTSFVPLAKKCEALVPCFSGNY